MPSLREAQEDFARGLFAGADAAVLAHLVGARGLDAGAGLAVYRNNVFSNYRGALREAYPVLLRLVGAAFFDRAADAFIHATPSLSGDVNAYGAGFGDFLAAFPGARAQAYLPDVARLEWAVHAAFLAGDATPLDTARLADVAPQRFAELRFTLSSSATLFASPWPALAIWRANQPDRDGCLDPAAGGGRLLIVRRGHDVELEPLSCAEFAALTCLAAQASLGAALDAALAADAGFALGAFLRRHAAAGTLADFTL